MAAQPERIFLIDGSNHAFRVFFAMPKMTAAGFPTGALLGFANMLRKLEADWDPHYIVVVFDKGASFRSELYPDYKGHRPETPPELSAQWPFFDDLVEAWGYRCVSLPGFEADDVIGTLARRYASPEREVYLVTGDKDMMQLVDANVRILDLMKDKVIDAAGVVERFGVGPDRVIDVLALAGDTSDNVPGVAGIGEKTAAKLVAEHGDLEGVLAAADQVGGKRGEALRTQADIARLSRRLVTIVTDADIPLSLGDLKEHARDVPRLRDLFVRWQFRSLLKHLDDTHGSGSSALDRDAYRAITDLDGLRAAADAIRAAGTVCVDLETTSLDPLTAEIVGIALCWREGDGVYVPVAHRGEGSAGQLSLGAALEVLGPLLADPAIGKVGQNLKYDGSVFAARGIPFSGIVGDTMLADYLLEPDRAHHGLDDLALRYLGHRMIAYSEATAGLPEGSHFGDVAIDAATRYAAEDADAAFRLHALLRPKLEAAEVASVYDTIEVPLVPVLGAMESRGIRLDVDRLAALGDELRVRIAASEEEIYGLAGRTFTINSPKQLQVILFEELGLDPIKKTKTGYSTDADTLDKLARRHPLPAAIVRYREMAKLLSTYVDTLPRAVHPVTGRIHTSFHQAVAATGRLSSNDPNLQNIPVRTDDGRRIRACFVPDPGHVFVSCDYSQIELRLLAHYCETGPLVDAFRAGDDIHRRTASEIFGVMPALVSPQQRSAAKAINFGIVYGMSAFRLANDLDISRAEAKRYLDNYFDRYGRVREVQEALIAAARDKGYTETLWGRRRPVPDIGSGNARDRAQAERLALNSPLQGSAADLIKRAMLRVHRRLEAEAGWGARLLLQVHDELLLEVPEGSAAAVAEAVAAEMRGAAELRVPLEVTSGIGPTWADAH